MGQDEVAQADAVHHVVYRGEQDVALAERIAHGPPSSSTDGARAHSISARGGSQGGARTMKDLRIDRAEVWVVGPETERDTWAGDGRAVHGQRHPSS